MKKQILNEPKLNIYTNEILRLIECYLSGKSDVPKTVMSINVLKKHVRDYIDSLDGRFDQTLIDRVPLDSSKHQTLIHSINVMQLTIFIAMNTGYEGELLEKIAIAALLHDIGKIHVPLEIINKPDKLTKAEFSVMKTHPELGAKFVEFMYPEISKCILEGILEHHERLDGSGYPYGITDISSFGRIIAVADTFEAFVAERPYHKGRSLKEGLMFMRGNKGFDEFYVKELENIVLNTMEKESILAKELVV